ncbi:hypothetical protein ACR8L8_22390, partial [Salmonella enterica subsp. enterica serovar Paratyphi A]|uniref:hypothetical protein n=1 Tax=Salmonella enterica TaxID=28901 RepID=UPI00329968C7
LRQLLPSYNPFQGCNVNVRLAIGDPLGQPAAVKRYSFFAYPRTCNTPVLHLISLFSCDYRWL